MNNELLFAAFCAGFSVSGEGWNAEYPFSDSGIDPIDNLRPKFEEWVREFYNKREGLK